MLRMIRPWIAGFVLLMISACNGTVAVPTPTLPPTLPPSVPLPTQPFSPPAGQSTLVPVAGPTLPATFEAGLKFANAAAPEIGRFKMDKARSFVDKQGHGAFLVYVLPGVGDLQVSLFLVYNDMLPNFGVNLAKERYDLETSLIKVEKIRVNVGDEAVVTVTNKQLGPREGQNMTVWAEMRFRNAVVILYPTPDLVSKLSDFSPAEATQFLQKMYDALPK